MDSGQWVLGDSLDVLLPGVAPLPSSQLSSGDNVRLVADAGH